MELITQGDLDTICKYAGQDPTDTAHNELVDVYKKLQYIGELLESKGFKYNIRKDPRKQAGPGLFVFQDYQWMKVYPKDLYSDCCDKFAYIIGLSDSLHFHMMGIKDYQTKAPSQEASKETWTEVDIGELTSYDNIVDLFIKFSEQYQELFIKTGAALGIKKCIGMKLEMETNKIVEILKQKKQIILQGAPGTGKTYATASIALSLLGVGYDPNNHSEIMQKYKEKCDEKKVFFTTFHQSMDYEDFVEGLKPKAENGGIIYHEENGIFKQVCEYATNIANVGITTCIDSYLQLIKSYKNKRTIPTKSGKSSINIWWNEGNDTISVRSTISKAQGTEETSQSPLNIEKVKLQAIGEGVEPNWSSYADAFIQAVLKEYKIGEQTLETPYLLIIDEINRGNISKIFGELITLLEADKRSNGNHPVSVTLPYSKTEFSVPSNLYIIGTMNTTDRSVGHIDYAVRRRFAFYTLKANTDAINSYYDNNKHDNETRDIALKLFEDIKAFVTKNKSDDFNIEDLMVGHSYFMAETKEELKMKLKYEIIPLMCEYEKDGIISLNNEQRKSLGAEWMSQIM